MNNINIDKYLAKINKKKEIPDSNKVLIKILRVTVVKVLICALLFLSIAIICKQNPNIKNTIYKEAFKQNFSFAKINNWYKKYLGGISPLENIFANNVEPVFNEKLTYKDTSKYLEGVALEVDSNYLVPILESGIVIFVGEKEGYRNTIIIQGMNGIDIWYGNINNSIVKLYDFVEKGNLLGEAKDKKLYLVYESDGNFLNYEEYLK